MNYLKKSRELKERLDILNATVEALLAYRKQVGASTSSLKQYIDVDKALAKAIEDRDHAAKLYMKDQEAI